MFPYGLADAADASGKKGSNVYEMNQWLWEFGRGKPRLGDLSVAATEERRIAVMKGTPKKAVATRVKEGQWRNGMKISLIQIFVIEISIG